jgi:hypothetical protein
LRGRLGDSGDRAVELLLIADDGTVFNITSRLVANDLSFALVIKLPQPGPPKPQLVMAVASGTRLSTLRSPQGTMTALGIADDVFARAMNEARQSGQLLNVSVKYFQLEN